MKPSEVFEIRRHNIGTDKAADLAVAAGYDFFAIDGIAFAVVAGPGPGYRSMGPLSALLMEDRSTIETEEPAADPFELSGLRESSIVVIDRFYADPLDVREKAIASDLCEHPERHKGHRSSDFPIPEQIRTFLGSIAKPGPGYSAFQMNQAGEQLVYHSDQQRWAGVVYLTPDAPPSGGTSFFRSKHTKVRSSGDLARFAGKDGWPSEAELEVLTYGGALLDRTRWEEVDRVGNVFNRAVFWNARLIHGVSEVFGHDPESARLCQLFFWDDA